MTWFSHSKSFWVRLNPNYKTPPSVWEASSQTKKNTFHLQLNKINWLLWTKVRGLIEWPLLQIMVSLRKGKNLLSCKKTLLVLNLKNLPLILLFSFIKVKLKLNRALLGNPRRLKEEKNSHLKRYSSRLCYLKRIKCLLNLVFKRYRAINHELCSLIPLNLIISPLHWVVLYLISDNLIRDSGRKVRDSKGG